MRPLLDAVNNLCEKRWFPLFFIPLSLAFLLVMSMTTSPLHSIEITDSSVFKTMGLALIEGKTLYKDIFDHKGFILYLINALGWLIRPGRLGIFLLQLLGMSMALFFLFKTARLFTSGAKSLIATLFSLFFLLGVFEGGNLTEEWNFYIFSIFLYIVARHLAKEADAPFRRSHAILLGVLLGLSFFIRPNDAVAVAGGLSLGLVAFIAIKKKDIRNSASTALFMVAGFVAIAIPIFAYFAHKNAVADMWYALIVFNSEYSGGLLSMIASTVLSKKKLTLLLFFITLCVITYNSRWRNLAWVLTPVCLLVLIFLGLRHHPHYYIILAPIVNIFCAIALSRNKEIAALSFSILLFTPLVANKHIVSHSLHATKQNVNILFSWQESYKIFYNETDLLLGKVPSDKRDSIWNYNLMDPTGFLYTGALIHSGIVQCNKITVARNERLLQEDNLLNQRPPYVALAHTAPFTADDSLFLAEYTLFASADTNICRMEIYKRND